MSLTTILLFLVIVSILGIIIGIIRKNRLILIGSVVSIVFLMLFFYFLIFILIPAM